MEALRCPETSVTRATWRHSSDTNLGYDPPVALEPWKCVHRTNWCSDNNFGLWSGENALFEFRRGHQLFWRFSWFSPSRQMPAFDLDYATTTSFQSVSCSSSISQSFYHSSLHRLDSALKQPMARNCMSLNISCREICRLIFRTAILWGPPCHP
jgi:hypothetical protein